jgi:F420 biosynthesis protein FbiB-like protein
MWPDAVEILRRRRTISKFADKPVEEERIRLVLEAGTWAPSAHNAQPWRFVVVLSEENKGRLADAMGSTWRKDLEKDGVPARDVEALLKESRDRILNAPALVVISVTMEDMDSYPDERRQELERDMAIQSAAACAQNMLLMAHAIGLGAGWNCAPLFAQDAVRIALGLGKDWSPVAMILLGTPEEEPEPPPRKSIDEVSVWK